MKMKMIVILNVLFNIIFFTITYAETIHVTGYGTSYDSALRNAYIQALDQVYGRSIENKMLVKDNILVYDLIRADITGFISDYKILNQYTKDNIYYVETDIMVNEQNINNKIVNTMHKDITVIYNTNNTNNNQINNYLQTIGFKNIDSINTTSYNNMYGLLLVVNEQPCKILYTADYGGWYHAYKPVTLTLINNNNVIISKSYTGIQEGITADIANELALEEALETSLEALRGPMSQYLHKPNVTYTIQINNFSVNKLNDLSDITGIYNIYIKSINGSTAVITAEYTRTKEELILTLKGEYKNGLIIVN